MPKEAKARILINEFLRKSGWRFFDDETGPANIALETHVKLKKKTLDAFGDDFEKTASGYVDYLLLDERGFPIAVLEAKSEKFDPLVGKEQARKYAHSQNVRFVILSNGNLHYFWDLEQGNPVLITEFPTSDSLRHFHAFKPNPDALMGEKIETDYVAATQNPNYRNDPRWNNPGQRDGFIKDLLNIVLLRPIFSPTDFIQIKGRGTRKYTFRHKEGGSGATLSEAHRKEKENFKLFDFFAVCEYFEEKFNYDEVIELPPLRPPVPPPPPPPSPPPPGPDNFTNVDPDPLKSQVEYAVPVYGMKIDRKFFEKFEDKVKATPEVRDRYERGDIKGAEEIVVAALFNKPEDFFNLDKLRKAIQIDRRITLREILAKAFGEIDRFQTKDELLEDELAKFVSIHQPDAAHMPVIRQFFKAYLTDGGVRTIVDSREFGRLADNPKVSLADVRALDQWRDVIPEYVKDCVSLNAFAA